MTDQDRYIAAWRQAMEACIALGERLAEEQWQARTECPEWTVKDVYAHLVGGEEWMAAGHPRPDEGLARIAEGPVAVRREYDGPRVLAELKDVFVLRKGQLAENPPDPQEQTFTAYLAPITMEGLLRMRAFDAWVHEQDVRRAIGIPGNLDSEGARIAAEIFASALPRIVGKTAGAPPGSVVRFTIDGELPFDQAVAVDDSGRGTLVRGSVVPGEGMAASLHLRMSWETFARLGAGRIAPESAPVTVEGDEELAARVLKGLAITP
jgi:uncharacterized protein (TIGR03083 family)